MRPLLLGLQRCAITKTMSKHIDDTVKGVTHLSKRLTLDEFLQNAHSGTMLPKYLQ